jgi:ElaB/YqjD/DUF883 family membrane-anchored ribosome-binding protein
MDHSGTAGEARVFRRIDESVGDVKQAAAEEIKNLISDVEDLLAKIAEFDDSDVAKLRTRVMRAVDSAKETLAQSTDTVRRQAQRAAATADDYVHESPWQAVGIAALVGAVVGILAARRP